MATKDPDYVELMRQGLTADQLAQMAQATESLRLFSRGASDALPGLQDIAQEARGFMFLDKPSTPAQKRAFGESFKRRAAEGRQAQDQVKGRTARPGK